MTVQSFGVTTVWGAMLPNPSALADAIDNSGRLILPATEGEEVKFYASLADQRVRAKKADEFETNLGAFLRKRLERQLANPGKKVRIAGVERFKEFVAKGLAPIKRSALQESVANVANLIWEGGRVFGYPYIPLPFHGDIADFKKVTFGMMTGRSMYLGELWMLTFSKVGELRRTAFSRLLKDAIFHAIQGDDDAAKLLMGLKAERRTLPIEPDDLEFLSAHMNILDKINPAFAGFLKNQSRAAELRPIEELAT